MGKRKNSGNKGGSSNSVKSLQKKKNKKQRSSSNTGAGGFKKPNKIVKKRHTWKSVRMKKKGDNEAQVEVSEVIPPSAPHQPSQQRSNSKGSLRTRMLERLSVARFRTINESIDSRPATSSSRGSTTSLNNPSVFRAYHAGLQSASSTWKTNPLDTVSDWILNRPSTKVVVVADFGCGDATLSKRLSSASSPKFKCHSFDLHNDLDPKTITACDMSNVPLPNQSVDIGVFCLSLMGSEVSQYVKEAWRVIKVGGFLKIAEVMGRVPQLGKFIKQVEWIGFKSAEPVQVLDGGVFGVFTFKRVKGNADKQQRKVELSPVVYKKR